MNWPTPEHTKMSDDTEFPKWVTPHESHVVRKVEGDAPASVSTPEWPECHVGRDGSVTVLVQNEGEQERALVDCTPPTPEPEHELPLEEHGLDEVDTGEEV